MEIETIDIGISTTEIDYSIQRDSKMGGKGSLPP
jgi:hypothetical protein